MPEKQINSTPDTSSNLRARAEERLKQKNLSTGPSALSTTSSPEAMQRMIQELTIHNIELEIQQEELLQAQSEMAQSLNWHTEAQKKAEKELQKSQQKFRSIAEQISELAFVVNETGMVMCVSPVVEKMFGYLPDEVTGHSFLEYLLEEDKSATLKMFNNTMREKAVKKIVDYRFKRKDGSFFYGEINLQYFEDDSQSGIIGLIWDISVRKHIDKKLIETRKRLSQALDAAQAGVWEWNMQTNENIWSDELWVLCGLEPRDENPTFKLWAEVIHPEDREMVIEKVLSAARNGTELNFEYRICYPDGSIHWLLSRGKPLMSETGKVDFYIGTIIDITERRLAESKAHEIGCRFEATIDAAQIGTWDWNIQTGEAIVNKRWCEIVGYTQEELVPVSIQTWKDLSHPDDFKKSSLLAEKHFNGELDFYVCECRMKHKNGDWIWVLDRGKLSKFTDEGKPLRVLGTHIDITARKLAEDQLQNTLHDLLEAKDRAEESDRLKSAFMANISHEIRTPMNGILGFTELLKDPHLTGEEQTEYIALIHKSGKRMLGLINDLMDISRLDAKEAKLQIAKTTVNGLLHELQAFFKPESDKRGLRLTHTSGLPDNESYIKTDCAKLTQILSNLIQNALKFTSKGGIDFGYTRKDKILEFYVIDSGIGIPINKKERIFERFHQVNNSLTRDHEGAGLGLSISKALVEILGGTIRVESSEGAGSNFTFTLPYNPVSSPVTSVPAFMHPSDEPQALTVLIAEDDDLSTILLKKNLKGQNLNILCAENGWEAVEIVGHHPEISLVLMDIKMPIMNGFEATKLIKQQRPDLPIIAQSAFTSKEDKAKARDAGCDAFITKPIDKNELISLISDVLKKAEINENCRLG